MSVQPCALGSKNERRTGMLKSQRTKSWTTKFGKQEVKEGGREAKQINGRDRGRGEKEPRRG